MMRKAVDWGAVLEAMTTAGVPLEVLVAENTREIENNAITRAEREAALRLFVWEHLAEFGAEFGAIFGRTLDALACGWSEGTITDDDHWSSLELLYQLVAVYSAAAERGRT